MGQTAEGALKFSAAATGLSVAEFVEKREGGEKWCTRCKVWHPVVEFGSDSSRSDGLAASCRASRKAHYDRTHVPRPRGPRAGSPRIITPEGRERMRAAIRRSIAAGKIKGRAKGHTHTPETRAKISRIVRERAVRGSAVHSYKDGKVAERRGERFSQEYKRWRFDVFSRDGFACRRCGDKRGGNLHAHHIKSFADFPDDRYVIANGLTLCEPCHKAFHSGEWPIEVVMPHG